MNTKTNPALLRVIVAYFMIYVVWGSTYYFIGVALKELTPMLLGAIRFTLAGSLLFLWSAIRKEPVWQWSMIWRSAISGVILLFVDMAVVMIAQTFISSSLVAIIASSTAIWIAALDIPSWRRNFGSWQKMTGLIIGFIGVALLFFEQLMTESGHTNSEYGVLLLCFGCMSWALGTLFAKYRSSGAEHVNASAGTAWQMLVAGFLFWIVAFSIGDVQQASFPEISMKVWLTVLYLVFMGSIVAYSSYIWLLKVRPAVEVSTHAYVNPVIAIFFGAMLGGEHITFIQVAGLAVILTSVMLVNKQSWKSISSSDLKK